jgi:hypothetical protein
VNALLKILINQETHIGLNKSSERATFTRHLGRIAKAHQASPMHWPSNVHMKLPRWLLPQSRPGLRPPAPTPRAPAKRLCQQVYCYGASLFAPRPSNAVARLLAPVLDQSSHKREPPFAKAPPDEKSPGLRPQAPPGLA